FFGIGINGVLAYFMRNKGYWKAVGGIGIIRGKIRGITVENSLSPYPTLFGVLGDKELVARLRPGAMPFLKRKGGRGIEWSIVHRFQPVARLVHPRDVALQFVAQRPQAERRMVAVFFTDAYGFL